MVPADPEPLRRRWLPSPPPTSSHGPGSLFTSLVTNLLVPGFLKRSQLARRKVSSAT